MYAVCINQNTTVQWQYIIFSFKMSKKESLNLVMGVRFLFYKFQRLSYFQTLSDFHKDHIDYELINKLNHHSGMYIYHHQTFGNHEFRPVVYVTNFRVAPSGLY